jgi:WD domain, G-beta repeat
VLLPSAVTLFTSGMRLALERLDEFRWTAPAPCRRWPSALEADGSRPVRLGLRPGSRRTEWPSTVLVWPLSDGDAPRPLWTEEEVSILTLAFSPDEEQIGRVSFAEHSSKGGPVFDGDISVRTLSTSAQQTLSIDRGEIRRGNYDINPGAAAKDLAFTSDGSTIVAAMLGLRAYRPDNQDDQGFVPYPQLVFYDARTLQPRRVVDLGGSDFAALAASSDGKLLATGHDANTVRLWTIATARQRAVFRWPVIDRRDVLGGALGGGSITSLAFHPNGRRLAVARDDGVALVDVLRGTRLQIAAAKDQGYSAIAFSPDGSSMLFCQWNRARQDVRRCTNLTMGYCDTASRMDARSGHDRGAALSIRPEREVVRGGNERRRVDTRRGNGRPPGDVGHTGHERLARLDTRRALCRQPCGHRSPRSDPAGEACLAFGDDWPAARATRADQASAAVERLVHDRSKDAEQPATALLPINGSGYESP